MTLTFDPATHLYRTEGLVRPSVTQIMQEAGESTDYSKVPKDLLAEASRRGSLVHAILAAKVQMRLDGSKASWGEMHHAFFHYQHAVEGLVKAGLNFLHNWEHQLTPSAIETPMYSDRFGFAGTRDLLAFLGDARAIFDWKCTVPFHHEAAEIQLGGYSILEEEAGRPVQQGYGVELRKNGTYQVHPIDLAQGRSRFLHALEKVRGITPEQWLQRIVPEAA